MAKPFIITGLDIGTGAIKLLTAFKREEEEKIEVLSKVQESSFGVRKGIVIDPNKAAEIINFLITKAEEECGQKIKEVNVSVGGSHIFSQTSHGLVSVSRADQKISEEDINRVLQAAQTFSLPSNKEILEIFPKEFIVDGEKGIKDPVGMNGVRLEVEAVAVVGFSPYLKNLNQAILNSGISLLNLTPTPLASARSVLTPRERELGVLLLDIGAGTTSLCIFEEENLIHLAVFPIGSGNITNDIAICLNTDIDTAEKIKIQFGNCDFVKKGKNFQKKEKIKIEGLNSEEPLFFTNKTLVQIIEARVAEILREVQKELKKIGKVGVLPAGIVLTGGGARLPNIKDFCKKYLKLPCRIGLAQGFSPELDDPSFASAAGLVLEGFDLIEKTGRPSIGSQGIFDKIKKFFRIFIP